MTQDYLIRNMHCVVITQDIMLKAEITLQTLPKYMKVEK